MKLDAVSLICVDCLNYAKAVAAILHSTKDIDFKDVLFFTDIDLVVKGKPSILIDSINSKEEYCGFLINKVIDYIKTDYFLIIQWDGFILNPESWTDEFLKYDYIGATWGYHDDRDMGNGGFSLRSVALMDIVRNDINIEYLFPEDHHICRTYRPYLESIGIKFAPDEIANLFAVECNGRVDKQFGFHQPRTHDIVRL